MNRIYIYTLILLVLSLLAIGIYTDKHKHKKGQIFVKSMRYEVRYIETGRKDTVEGIAGYNRGDYARDDEGNELEILLIVK